MKDSQPAGWYLIRPAGHRPDPPPRRFLLEAQWKKVALSVLFGGLVGGAFAASHLKRAGNGVGVMVKAADPGDIARLETRNRRLEALVWVLRHRGKKAPGSE